MAPIVSTSLSTQRFHPSNYFRCCFTKSFEYEIVDRWIVFFRLQFRAVFRDKLASRLLDSRQYFCPVSREGAKKDVGWPLRASRCCVRFRIGFLTKRLRWINRRTQRARRSGLLSPENPSSDLCCLRDLLSKSRT